MRNDNNSSIKQQDSVKKDNKWRNIDYVKHFLLPGLKSIRISKIEKKADFPPFPLAPYSDVGIDNCANISICSESANLKLSKCYNYVNLKIRSRRSQEFTSWSFIASPRLLVTLVINYETYDFFFHFHYDFGKILAFI